MPLERVLILDVFLMLVLESMFLAFSGSNSGCTPSTYSNICSTVIHFGKTATSVMEQTFLRSWCLFLKGSKPITSRDPSDLSRPKTACKKVDLPAPLGPIRPNICP